MRFRKLILVVAFEALVSLDEPELLFIDFPPASCSEKTKDEQ